MPDSKMAGLVLAGGRSSRFGAEKAVQLLGGRPLMAWSLAALETCCDAVAVNAPMGSEAAQLAGPRTVIADDPALAVGPLTGIAAGLAWAAAQGFDRLATLPCDTPLVDESVLRALAAGAEETGCAYALTADGPQALCAIWPVSAAAALIARLASGEHPAVRAFLAEIGGQAVMFEDASRFANLNHASDLARLERLASDP